MAGDIILEVKNLKKYFPLKDKIFSCSKSYVKAVDDVSFEVCRGQVLGLVGESGCGKTTISRTILGLIEPSGGEIYFEGENLIAIKDKTLRNKRSGIQMVFQDPYSSLNPRMRIGDTISEPMVIRHKGDRKSRRRKVEELLVTVGLEPEHANRYPHEFSGGQRQRIGIARVLAAEPRFMICDEPVSALDVSIRSQILNLLVDMKEQFGLTMLFISHDLSVVEYLCDRIIVMYLGKIFEIADRKDLYRTPLHPYTIALLSAVPVLDPTMKKERIILQGDAPSPINPPEGCRFHTRCPKAHSICKEKEPELIMIDGGHCVACHLYTE